MHRPRPKREWIGILDKAPNASNEGTASRFIESCSASPPGDRRWTISMSRSGRRAVALVVSTSPRRVGPSKSDNVRLHQSGVANRRNTVRSNHGRRFPNRGQDCRKPPGTESLPARVPRGRRGAAMLVTEKFPARAAIVAGAANSPCRSVTRCVPSPADRGRACPPCQFQVVYWSSARPSPTTPRRSCRGRKACPLRGPALVPVRAAFGPPSMIGLVGRAAPRRRAVHDYGGRRTGSTGAVVGIMNAEKSRAAA